MSENSSKRNNKSTIKKRHPMDSDIFHLKQYDIYDDMPDLTSTSTSSSSSAAAAATSSNYSSSDSESIEDCSKSTTSSSVSMKEIGDAIPAAGLQSPVSSRSNHSLANIFHVDKDTGDSIVSMNTNSKSKRYHLKSNVFPTDEVAEHVTINTKKILGKEHQNSFNLWDDLSCQSNTEITKEHPIRKHADKRYQPTNIFNIDLVPKRDYRPPCTARRRRQFSECSMDKISGRPYAFTESVNGSDTESNGPELHVGDDFLAAAPIKTRKLFLDKIYKPTSIYVHDVDDNCPDPLPVSSHQIFTIPPSDIESKVKSNQKETEQATESISMTTTKKDDPEISKVEMEECVQVMKQHASGIDTVHLNLKKMTSPRRYIPPPPSQIFLG